MSTALLVQMCGLVFIIVFSMISRKVMWSIFEGILIMVIVDLVLVKFVDGVDTQGIFMARPVVGAFVGGVTAKIAGIIKPKC